MNGSIQAQNARIHNALQDVRLYVGILAGSDHDESERQFLKDHIDIAVNRVEELATQNSMLDDIKRFTGEALARSIEPSFSPEAWTNEYLYGWLDQHDCVWLYTRKDWMNLNVIANNKPKHIQALQMIYAADDLDIDTRYCIPTMANLKVQSLGYRWDDENGYWKPSDTP